MRSAVRDKGLKPLYVETVSGSCCNGVLNTSTADFASVIFKHVNGTGFAICSPCQVT